MTSKSFYILWSIILIVLYIIGLWFFNTNFYSVVALLIGYFLLSYIINRETKRIFYFEIIDAIKILQKRINNGEKNLVQVLMFFQSELYRLKKELRIK